MSIGHAARLLGALLLATAARAAQPAELSRLFPFERDVIAERAGLNRLPLPADVLAATRPDLSDLRLFDATGREVPYLIDAALPAGESRQLARLLDATVVEAQRARVDRDSGPPLFRETYVVAAPPAGNGATWELVFEVDRAHFVRRLSVDAIAADGATRPLLRDESIFRLASPAAAKLRVALPLSSEATDAARPIRLAVTIEGEEGDYLG
ncbi:MAG: hypothetical protein ABI629_19065, partial [bacterium]